MNKVLISVIFIFIIVMGINVDEIKAQKPLKGVWTFEIKPSQGASLIEPFNFKSKGKGIAGNNLLSSVFAYRETSTTFSLALEPTGTIQPAFFPTGTIIIRGNKLDDNTIQATAIIFTDMTDNSSPIGFSIVTAIVFGRRT